MGLEMRQKSSLRLESVLKDVYGLAWVVLPLEGLLNIIIMQT